MICFCKKFQLFVFCADIIYLMIAVLGPFSHPILKSLKIVYLQPSTTTPALLSPCLLTSERYQALCDITKGCKLKVKLSSVVVSHLVSSSIVSWSRREFVRFCRCCFCLLQFQAEQVPLLPATTGCPWGACWTTSSGTR